jgi:hypothetical protein
MTTTNRPIDIEDLSRALGKYFDNHPEAARVRVCCYSEDDCLLMDLNFSPKNRTKAAVTG